jgi:hypothetical protein
MLEAVGGVWGLGTEEERRFEAVRSCLKFEEV